MENYEETAFWDLLNGFKAAYRSGKIRGCEILEDLKKPKKSFLPSFTKKQKEAREKKRKEEEELRIIQQKRIDKCETRNRLIIVLLNPDLTTKMKEILGYMSNPLGEDFKMAVTRLRMKIKYFLGLGVNDQVLYADLKLLEKYIGEFLEIIEDSSESMTFLKY